MKKLLIVLLLATATFAQAATNLASVKKIYVEKMDNNLDQYLVSAISKTFHGSIAVVLEKGNADAILRGVNTAAQTTTQGTVELVDPSGTTVLWSGTAGDRNKVIRKHEGDEKVAGALMEQLKKAMQPK